MATLSLLERREVPLFALADATGRVDGTQRAWQRREVLLALLHGPDCVTCEHLLEHLQARSRALEEQDVHVVALEPIAREGVLGDTCGRVAARVAEVLGEPPGPARLVVATRYLRIAAVFDVHAGPPEALLTEVLEAMRLAQTQCEECSQPLQWD